MYKLVVLHNTPRDPAHFRDYYVKTHLPLAAKLPRLLQCHHSFEVRAPDGSAPFFAIWEGHFADTAAFAAAMGSDIGREVAADTANYADGGLTIMHYAVE